MQADLKPFRSASRRRHPLMRAAGTIFLTAAIAVGIALLWDDRDALLSAMRRSDPFLLFLGFLCAFANLACAGFSWTLLLRDQQVSLSLHSGIRIFALGQVAKYLPGSVWSYVASAELGRDAGFRRLTIVSSFLLALIIGLGTGVLLALVTMPELLLPKLASNWFLLLALGGLPLLTLFAFRGFLGRLTKLEPFPQLSNLIGSTIIAILGWLFAGLQICLFAAALGQTVDAISPMMLTGIYAASWIIGFLFVVAPAGLGPREATMIALLVSMMPVEEAALIALLSRVAMTFADVFAAMIVAVITKPQAAK